MKLSKHVRFVQVFARLLGLKLVYSPLNGSGLVPVTRVLNDIGITDITIVPEQEYPNGYFTTCSYPNPEIFEALKLGLDLAKESGADLMLATDLMQTVLVLL